MEVSVSRPARSAYGTLVLSNMNFTMGRSLMKRLPSCSLIPRKSCALEFCPPGVGYTCRAIGWWENRQTPLMFTQTLEQQSASCAGKSLSELTRYNSDSFTAFLSSKKCSEPLGSALKAHRIGAAMLATPRAPCEKARGCDQRLSESISTKETARTDLSQRTVELPSGALRISTLPALGRPPSRISPVYR